MKVEYRTMSFGNFRQILHLKKLDWCGLIKNSNIFPAIKNALESAKKYVGGFFMQQPCPMKWMGVTNGSFSFKENVTFKDFKKMNLFISNGQQRGTLKVWNEKDSNIMTSIMLSTLKVYANEQVF